MYRLERMDIYTNSPIISQLASELNHIKSKLATVNDNQNLSCLADHDIKASVEDVERRLEGMSIQMLTMQQSIATTVERSAQSFEASKYACTAFDLHEYHSTDWQGSSTADSYRVQSGETSLKSYINDLVSSLLTTYSRDTIGKRDYALMSGGASVFTKLTSLTFQQDTHSFWPFSRFGMPEQTSTMLPRSALTPSLELGQCWAMDGSNGHLAIQLPRAVNISELTIDHIPMELADDMTSAPRELKLWGAKPDVPVGGVTSTCIRNCCNKLIRNIFNRHR